MGVGLGAETLMIGGANLLIEIEKDNPRLGQFLRRYVIKAIETTAQNAGVSPTGKIAPPAPPEAVNVSTSGEMMQITVNHSAPIQKGVQYTTHISTDPSFSAPIIVDHGSSRSPQHIILPTRNGAGDTHDYYVRTGVQYPGSDPSEWTYHGGASPIKVNMAGTTQMDIQPGTGSGTGSADGQQSSVGLGKAIFRAAPAPKRAVNGT